MPDLVDPVQGDSMDKVILAEKFNHIREFWTPYVVAELNAQQVKLDKLKGEFVWHHHPLS